MNKTHRPRGFTLIELLMVIAIIGLLVSLAAYAAIMAIYRARVTAIAIDIQSVTGAMYSYKGDHKQYPPDFSDSNYASRQNRFQYHIGLAFPRSSITSYATVKSYILTNYQKAYGYNYKGPGGTLSPLNLDTLDQAEALVFWLGGFPTPFSDAGVPLGSKKLFGFHTDVTNPFRLDSGVGTSAAFRTTSLLDFDETRLVDNDQDGWLEYIPPGPAQGTNGKTPPHVYFDAGSYTQVWPSKSTPAYCGYPMPRPSDPNGQMQQLMSAWGIAVPYAQWFYASASPPTSQWMNPATFQIVSAGLDGTYGNPASTTVRVPCFPSGATFAVPSLSQGFFDQQELDNVANFTRGTIDDDSAAQQGAAPGSGS